MREGLRIALALPLLMPTIQLTSLAVIAAIAVLVYEVRSFFGRSPPGTPLSPAAGTPPRLPVPPEHPRAPAPEAAADGVAVLRAEPISLSEPEAPLPAPPGTPPGAALPSRGDMMPAAALSEPLRAPIMTAPRERAQDGDRRIDGRLALAGAIVIGLALLWLAARAVRRRGRE